MLITGGAGFTGTHLVNKLFKFGERVRVLDIKDTTFGCNVECIKGDIRDVNIVNSACKGVDVVFHTVAVVPISRSSKERFEDIIVNGTENLLRACEKNNVRKVIHMSSSAVYGIPKSPADEHSALNPIGNYGRAKLKAEQVCYKHMKNLDITILRPRAIVGKGRLGLYGILFDWIKSGKKVYIIGSGNNKYQMLSIDDLVDACLLSINKGSNEIFCLGSSDFLTVREELELLIKHANTNSKVVSINKDLVKFTLKTFDFVGLSPMVSWHYMGGGEDFVFDITKARKILDWNPKVSDVEALIEAYDWFIENYEEIKMRKGTTHTEIPGERILKLVKWLS